MTDINYNDGNWHHWHGGDCPVHPKTVVRYVWEDGDNTGVKTRIAGRDENDTSPAWSSGLIVMFKVVDEHKDPVTYSGECWGYHHGIPGCASVNIGKDFFKGQWFATHDAKGLKGFTWERDDE